MRAEAASCSRSSASRSHVSSRPSRMICSPLITLRSTGPGGGRRLQQGFSLGEGQPRPGGGATACGSCVRAVRRRLRGPRVHAQAPGPSVWCAAAAARQKAALTRRAQQQRPHWVVQSPSKRHVAAQLRNGHAGQAPSVVMGAPRPAGQEAAAVSGRQLRAPRHGALHLPPGRLAFQATKSAAKPGATCPMSSRPRLRAPPRVASSSASRTRRPAASPEE